jgi:hypothetical protein
MARSSRKPASKWIDARRYCNQSAKRSWLNKTKSTGPPPRAFAK